MKIEEVATIYQKYKEQTPIQKIHELDTMWSTGRDWYWSVGESAIAAICRSLIAAPTREVRAILDFGCGWGRVGRQLRAAFPSSQLLFCELNVPAAEFCAETFDGSVVPSGNLPNNIDLIWVGSVFTHIDYERMKALYQSLANALSPNGLLVATFHGRRAVEIAKRRPYISAVLWERILSDYETSGAGYASYGRADLGDYGVSLTKPSKIVGLGELAPQLKLAGFQEAGWANHQDVAAWSKAAVSD